MQIFFRILVPVCVLAFGWFGMKLLSVKEEKGPPPEKEARLIKTQVIELRRGNFQTVVGTQGIVSAHNLAPLTGQVSGKVIWISPNLEDGAFFDDGQTLIQLNDEDFQGEVVSAEAQLARTQAAEAQEIARGKQALLNWQDLGYDEEPNELVLRKPQMREAEANVKAAQATLAKARRELERTAIRAPFAGRVLDRTAVIGQSVGPTTPLAQIFKTDFAEVRLPIEADKLSYLDLPETGEGTPVEVLFSDALRPDSVAEWKGKIIGVEGALDAGSRELFAIARVDDPFSRTAPTGEELPMLRIGQPVRASIDGTVLEDVFVIPRSAVRNLKLIYLVDKKDQTLKKHEIEPIWGDKEHIVVSDPTIENGTLLATTKMIYAPEDAKVEILPASEEPPVTSKDAEAKGDKSASVKESASDKKA